MIDRDVCIIIRNNCDDFVGYSTLLFRDYDIGISINDKVITFIPNVEAFATHLFKAVCNKELTNYSLNFHDNCLVISVKSSTLNITYNTNQKELIELDNILNKLKRNFSAFI